MYKKISAVIIIMFSLLVSNDYATGISVRIKDLCRIGGVRSNQLVGYGIIVGLKGTGDGKGTFFTAASIANLLEQFGVAVDKGKLSIKNCAAVIVTCELPSFAREGDTIDVIVSALGDASNLNGGILLQTPLLAANKQVYAVAQGPVSIGGGKGAKDTHPTVGRVTGGAIVEKEVPVNIKEDDALTLILHKSDFTTASRIADNINTQFNTPLAAAVDASQIRVQIPSNYETDLIKFISALEGLTIEPDMSAKVIINERTGTVVMGEQIKISKVAISHGNLTLTIKEEISPKERIEREERLIIMQPGVTVDKVVKALNAVGVTPRDIINILQAIKEAGALYAEIVLM